MKDCYVSKKLNIKIRRIQIAGRSYTVRPSFVMPYMTGQTHLKRHRYKKTGLYTGRTHDFCKKYALQVSIMQYYTEPTLFIDVEPLI